MTTPFSRIQPNPAKPGACNFCAPLTESGKLRAVIVPAAVQARGLRVIDHYPVDSEFRLQPLEIRQLEVSPPLRRCYLALPVRPQFRHCRYNSRVFNRICQLAAFRQREKSVILLARSFQVIRIQREIGIYRGVRADPRERLQPWIRGHAPRQLQMLAGGELRPLRHKHRSIGNHQKRSPAPYASLEHKLSQQASSHQHEEEVKQMKKAHRLQWCKPHQTFWPQDDHCQQLMKHAIDKHSQGKARQYRLPSLARHAPENPKRIKGANAPSHSYQLHLYKS